MDIGSTPKVSKFNCAQSQNFWTIFDQMTQFDTQFAVFCFSYAKIILSIQSNRTKI